MKVKVITNEKKFEPIKMEITIETLNELKAFRGLYGICSTVAGTVCAKAKMVEGLNVRNTSELYRNTFKPLDEILISLVGDE